MKKTGSNIFVSLLNALGIKHTNSFSNKYYNEHPYKYSLFGISKMLSDYGISNAGTKVEDKLVDISNIETPFVAHVGGDFCLVYNVSKKEVEYRIGNIDINVSHKNFCNLWSGVILLVKSGPGSIEPDYRNNYRKSLFNNALKIALALTVLTLITLIVINNQSYRNIGLLLSFLLSSIGAYIGYLLVRKQLNFHSSYGDKICSLFKHTDCNNILESNASKLWGIFSWSTIGMAYFLANLVIILFVPHLIIYYALINLCGLPYTIWSVWYQKFKVRQWCILCLMVQILIWCIFIINISFGYIQIPTFELSDTVLVGIVYLLLFLSTTLFIQHISKESKIEIINQEINSLKSHEGVIELLLREQPHYACDKSTSSILFGNPNADILVTILTNPHCNPCGKIHARVENLLKLGLNNLSFQYIFTSFDSSLDKSNKFLIGAYLNRHIVDVVDIYHQWFNRENINKEELFEKFSSIDIVAIKVEEEFQKHEKWRFETKLETTPTILINGYKLPKNFQIEDLKFVSNLTI